ncbi:hypothetical protein EYF80_024393 [Liparis tanakae]|uniref:Uncharacterized protein n=1 Tax=Liparis tanakae TaxID=230148 RepID=A0A4Z2HHP8_9TELE|nr:hypothetical protein EYF80_024393 [Liparis tanakae]
MARSKLTSDVPATGCTPRMWRGSCCPGDQFHPASPRSRPSRSSGDRALKRKVRAPRSSSSVTCSTCTDTSAITAKRPSLTVAFIWFQARQSHDGAILSVDLKHGLRLLGK